jgi:hypothetical protein
MKENNFLMLLSVGFYGIGLFNYYRVKTLKKRTNKTNDILVEIKAQKYSCVICLIMAMVYSLRLIYLITQ